MILPDPSYLVEIDEDGYPMFSGIRSQDNELNRQIFHAMKRSDPNRMSSRLITYLSEHQSAWVSAFDDPLVVQSVDLLADPQLRLRFPGGFQQDVLIRDLQVDAFQRFHCFVGDQVIPAVFSRKAQAAMLQLPEIPEQLLKAAVFRSVPSEARDQKFWNDLYLSGGDLWELHRVNTAIEHGFLASASKIGSRILVPAAGRGHEAAFLATHGRLVTALDFSEEAQREFSKIYPASRAKYEVGDAFPYLQKNPQAFDAVCEHTFYCAIEPARRPEYWNAIHQALVVGGVLFGVFYLKTHLGGPPYGCTQWEIRESIRDRFQIEEWEISEHSPPNRAGEELWVILRRL